MKATKLIREFLEPSKQCKLQFPPFFVAKFLQIVSLLFLSDAKSGRNSRLKSDIFFFFISNPPFCICSYCRPTAITYTFFFHYQYYNFAREYSSSSMRGFFSPFQTSEYIAYFRIQILKNDNKTFFSPFVHLRNLETFADTECQC